MNLISLCIRDMPEKLSSLSSDDEEYIKCSFTSLIDCSNFLDHLQFFIIMQENLELLVNSLTLLQKYHHLMNDSSPIFKFLLEFLDRTYAEQQWQMLEIDQTLCEILKASNQAFVIEKSIECVALMLMTNNEDYLNLYLLFHQIILGHFGNHDLKVIILIIF